MRKLLCIVTICILIVSSFAGCGVLQKLGLQKNDSDELTPVSSIAIGEEEAMKLNESLPVYLYFATSDNTKLKQDVKYVPLTEAKKSVNSLATAIVNELIKGPNPNSGLIATIPKEAKLRGTVKIDGNVATVDFTKEFVEKHPGGTEAEKMTIYSIVNSLTELTDITKVKFLIEGKAEKNFKGSFQFDQAFPRTAQLIDRTVAEVETSGSADSNDANAGTGTETSTDSDVSGGGDEETYVEVLE